MEEKPWTTVLREQLGYLSYLTWPYRAALWYKDRANTPQKPKKKAPQPKPPRGKLQFHGSLKTFFLFLGIAAAWVYTTRNGVGNEPLYGILAGFFFLAIALFYLLVQTVREGADYSWTFKRTQPKFKFPSKPTGIHMSYEVKTFETTVCTSAGQYPQFKKMKLPHLCVAIRMPQSDWDAIHELKIQNHVIAEYDYCETDYKSRQISGFPPVRKMKVRLNELMGEYGARIHRYNITEIQQLVRELQGKLATIRHQIDGMHDLPLRDTFEI